jgi:acetyltransferase-like isoleucine patch superfamily enzyme
MWGIIIGGLLGAGAGYGLSVYSKSEQNNCFIKNLPTESEIPADATAADRAILTANVSEACHTAHPVRSVIGDDTWLSTGGAAVLGGLIGHFAFRKK